MTDDGVQQLRPPLSQSPCSPWVGPDYRDPRLAQEGDWSTGWAASEVDSSSADSTGPAKSNLCLQDPIQLREPVPEV